MKPTYKQLETKDDKLFIKHAEINLRGDWDYIWLTAMDEFNKHSRPSVAKREANLVILAELKRIGKEHWRHPTDEKPVERIPPRPATLPQRNGGKKWEGKSIEQMMDENLKRMRGNSTI